MVVCTAPTWTKWRPSAREVKLEVRPAFPVGAAGTHKVPPGRAPSRHSLGAHVCLLHVTPISSRALHQQVPLPSSALQPHPIPQAHSRAPGRFEDTVQCHGWVSNLWNETNLPASLTPATHARVRNLKQPVSLVVVFVVWQPPPRSLSPRLHPTPG